MNELMTFTTRELMVFISSLAIFILVFIQLRRFYRELIPTSFEFSNKHFMIGLSVAISSCIALINWTTYESKTDYVTTVFDDPNEIIQTPTSAYPIKKKVIPPPPPEKKKSVATELAKLNLIEDATELVDDKPLVDQQDVVAPVSQIVESAAPEVAPIVAPVIEEEKAPFIRIAEQMPRFPGCEDIDADKATKEACAKKNLMHYIYDNLKYPRLALENGIEGMAVLQFVVTKEGRIRRIKVVRDPGGGCAAAVVKIVEGMNTLTDTWTPGKQRGKPVNVLFTLPVKFAIN